MIDLYRCARCRYIEDISGTGAFTYGGRWNSKGVRVLYTASNASLALLEVLVHIRPLISNDDFCLLHLECDSDLVLKLDAINLPINWYKNPFSAELAAVGDRFVREEKYLLLQLPSAILPVESNFLINPSHPHFKKIKVKTISKLDLDHRLLK